MTKRYGLRFIRDSNNIRQHSPAKRTDFAGLCFVRLLYLFCVPVLLADQLCRLNLLLYSVHIVFLILAIRFQKLYR